MLLLLLLVLLLLHHLLLHLLLHLLHHLRVHIAHHVLRAVSAAASTHHLLHLLHLHHVLPHGWVHVHATVHGHLSLHHGKVLLHSLEVLRHNLRRHAAVAHLLAHALVAGLVVLLELVALGSFFLFAEIATGLRPLHLNGFAVYLEGYIDTCLDAGLAFECHETKTSGTPRVLVHHERGVNNSAKLGKIVAEFLIRRLLADTPNKYFARLFLFISWNGSLGINLGSFPSLAGIRVTIQEEVAVQAKTYNLAVQKVLLNHDNIHCFGILEC